MIRWFAPLLAATLAMATVASAEEHHRPNHLLGTASPYLLQHLFNPVDWYPWGAEALTRAKQENKLIFVSVGYSACHWCHVMEEESFEDEATADLLNSAFISIKIDRERRPDLDEHFMVATQILTGTGGWPNSVFLTPDGQPFYAGGYFPPEEFATLLGGLAMTWLNQPDRVRAEGARVAAAVTSYLTQTAPARDLSADEIAAATDAILAETDPFYGGIGVAPKFPREPLFLFLLDQADRTANPDLLATVTRTLDAMIMGGIHDHVGGGFHRYAIDPEWHIPHFEKMLYNQALIGRLLIRTWDLTGHTHYARAADRLFDYVLRDITSAGGGFYAAQDADSTGPGGEREEGVFYTWTPADLTPLGADTAFIRDLYQVTENGELDGANVLNLQALPKDLATVLGRDPRAFSARIDRNLETMRALRDTRAPPFRDEKIIASWNGEMIATLAEAAFLLDRPDLYAAAEKAARHLLAALPGTDGLRRVILDGAADVPAQLPDYAALGRAMIALHDYAPHPADRPVWLGHAVDLAQQAQARFGDSAGPYRMASAHEGLGPNLSVDDTEIPSGNALALSLLTAISHRRQAPQVEHEAYRLAAAIGGAALDQPQFRGFALKALQDHAQGTVRRIRYAAKGAVRLELGRPVDGRIELTLNIADGWHINAHEPLEDYFIPTAVSGPGLLATYPDATVKSLAFNDTPLALYEGRVIITAQTMATSPQRFQLTLQACSDEICLQPEDLTFTIWAP